MSQTTVSVYGNAAFKGMLYDTRINDVMSYAAEAVVGFARPVQLGTNKDKQVIHATTGAAAMGVALATHAHEQAANGDVNYTAGETVSVLKVGRVWVETNDAVVAGAVANYHVASGKFTDEAVAAGIEAFTQLSPRFITSTSAAGLAVVEIK